LRSTCLLTSDKVNACDFIPFKEVSETQLYMPAALVNAICFSLIVKQDSMRM